ncbi:MAG: PD-(D/E)XK nuclease family protein [Muribaculaceae bacterium]|nr:PD-(D/E)XK nuclease family protein [Muribaculaceae bacterium]
MAIPFLQSIAKAYAERYRDMSRHIFVFPNRRAGTFFLKNLLKYAGNRNAILPRVTTMTDFVEEISGRVVAGRIELLFVLYRSYVSLLQRLGVESIPEFDSFRRWGETALSDFNEVDMQSVDADAVFKNVKDVKEISANFLTDEQMQVMEEFFGQAFDPEIMATGFWKEFNDTEGEEGLKPRFRMIWQELGPLYHSLHEELENNGLITSGGAYRKAAELLEEHGAACLDADRIAMIGFNALTASERRIFDALAEIEPKEDDGDSFASFFWDATGPVLSDVQSAAARYVQFGMRRWPMPEWSSPYLSESEEKGMPPEMRVISVPSNSLQTKVISEILEDWASTHSETDFTDAKVAVVLPDEGLLIPMLYSVPESIPDVNITMGYPLRLTSTYTYVSLLRRLQSSRRKAKNGETGYYYKDLNLVLSHPYSQRLFGESTSKVKEWLRKHHCIIVDISSLNEIDEKFGQLIPPLPDDADEHKSAEWIDRILKSVADELSSRCDEDHQDSVDLANINVYRLALARLLDTVEEYGIKMQWRTYLSLTDRLLASETVNFEGQPLKGLQVMGLLETRALDFERVIIPSLNERILPMRRRARTFISDSLRKAYGLPPVNYSETLFAYYFYRMISRAKEVVMLYDGRSSEGARSGDVSRYVLQLKYLYARGHLKMESRTFEMSKSDRTPSPVAKTPRMMEELEAFCRDGEDGYNLSATALMGYAACQVRFYFEHVLRIKTDEPEMEYIDPMTHGSVIHEVMQHIYLPELKHNRYLEQPEVIDAATIKSRIDNPRLIDTLIRRAINKHHNHLEDPELDAPLEGALRYVAKAFRNQVIGILRFDLSQAPITLYGVEIKEQVKIKMPDGREINMKYAIDRIDSPKGCVDSTGHPVLRIVDYKTGQLHNKAASMEMVFRGDPQGRNLLQLWLYANLFDAVMSQSVKDIKTQSVRLFGDGVVLPTRPYILEFYDIGGMSSMKHSMPEVENVAQSDHTEQNPEFLGQLQRMLMELFDINEPFRPSEYPKTCDICPFKTLC